MFAATRMSLQAFPFSGSVASPPTKKSVVLADYSRETRARSPSAKRRLDPTDDAIATRHP
jgi:hypothetical protein